MFALIYKILLILKYILIAIVYIIATLFKLLAPLPLILSFSILCLIGVLIIFIILLLLKDNFFRDNTAPVTFFLDYFLPSLLLLSPCYIVKWDLPWTYKYIIIFIYLIFFIIPVMSFWRDLRDWPEFTDSAIIFRDPSVFFLIPLGLIYPLLFGFFLSLSRFVRLGDHISQEKIIAFLNPEILGFVISSLPLFFVFIMIFLNYSLHLRHYLWKNTSALLNYLHTCLLQYRIYFKIMEKIYKLHYIFFNTICGMGINPKKKMPEYIKLLKFLYYNPSSFGIIVLSFICAEFFYKQELFWSFYLLFFFPIIYSIMHLFNSFGHSIWVFDCCFTDYLKKNWKYPKYPITFFEWMKDPEENFGIALDLKSKDNAEIAKQTKKFAWKLRKSVIRPLHNLQLEERVLFMGWKYRIATSYRTRNFDVRWMKTATEKTAKIIFNNTSAVFCKNTVIKSVLAENSYDHVPLINMFSTRPFYAGDIFKPDPTLPKQSSFPSFEDYTNHILKVRLNGLRQTGVKIEPYEHGVMYTNTPAQANPDLTLKFAGSNYLEQGVYGIDLKHIRFIGTGANLIIAKSVAKANTALTYLQRSLESRAEGISTEQQNAIALLKKAVLSIPDLSQTGHNIVERIEKAEDYQRLWAANVHHFPGNAIPPLWTYPEFPTIYATENTQHDFIKGKGMLQKMHDIFQKNRINIPNADIITAGQLRKKAEATGLLEDRRAFEDFIKSKPNFYKANYLVKENFSEDILDGSFIQTMLA